MSEIGKPSNTVWIIIVAIIGAAWLYGILRDDDDINPRLKKGIDTIYVKDSAYVIKFKIDTAYELEREIEPKDKP